MLWLNLSTRHQHQHQQQPQRSPGHRGSGRWWRSRRTGRSGTWTRWTGTPPETHCLLTLNTDFHPFKNAHLSTKMQHWKQTRHVSEGCFQILPGGQGGQGGKGGNPVGAKGGEGGLGGAGGFGGGVGGDSPQKQRQTRRKVAYPADVTEDDCPNYPFCQ